MPRKKLAHIKKESQLLVGLLILSLALVVSGCRRGPRIEACVFDGISQASCSYKKERYTKPINEMNNYICFTPNDTERLIKSCHEQTPAEVITCLISTEDESLYCAGDLEDFILKYAEATNYICLSPESLERFLKYCFR